jgi:ActR/RegA family two-component response regulator
VTDNVSLSELSGSGATRELHQTIKEFNAKTSQQTHQLLVLTWVIAILTAVMAVGVGVQIYLAWKALP